MVHARSGPSEPEPGEPEPGEPEPSEEALLSARKLAASQSPAGTGHAELVRTFSGTWIARTGHVVVKVHPLGSSAGDLSARLQLAGEPELRECVLAPLVTRPLPLTQMPPNGSTSASQPPVWGTVWPRVEPLPQDVEVPPWAAIGALLARLHRTAPPWPDRVLPVQGSVRRLRLALRRLFAVTGHSDLPTGLGPAVDAVHRAARGLPDACWRPGGGPDRPAVITHGDWHLGQLGQLPGPDGAGRWRLIDVDDLGWGDPVWDLGRPAAFWAAGLLPDAEWGTFLGAYRTAGGPAVPPEPADPWPALDAVAQASIVVAAAGAARRVVLGQGEVTDIDRCLFEVCAGLPGGG